MLTPIYKGFALGLFLAFSFGPAFFALINTGIKNGFRAAAFLAIGIFLSDVVLVLLTFVLLSLGASAYLSEPKNQSFIGVIGGIVLIIYGLLNFYNKPPKTEAALEDDTQLNHLNIENHLIVPGEKLIIEKIPKNNSRPIWLGVKGFFLNLFNPSIWIFWLGTTTAMCSSFSFSTLKIVLFFSTTLGVVLALDLLKGFVANKIKRYLTDKLMKIINYISGSMLIFFGLYLIYSVFFGKELYQP